MTPYELITFVSNCIHDSTEDNDLTKTDFFIEKVQQNVNNKDHTGKSSIFYSIYTDEIFNILIKFTDKSIRDSYGNSILHYLSNINDTQKMKSAIFNGVSFGFINSFGRSFIDGVIMNDNDDIIKMIMYNYDFSYAPDGITPFVYACKYKAEKIVRCLINSRLPLCNDIVILIENDMYEQFEYAISLGLNVEFCAMKHFIEKNNLKSVHYLSKYTDMDEVYDDCTYLSHAIFNGNFGMVKYLSYICDFMYVDSSGYSLYMYAQESSNPKISDYFDWLMETQ